MATELEKGMALLALHVDEPLGSIISQARPTGKLRWNGPTLEQEHETIYYRDGRPDHGDLTWVPVPSVPQPPIEPAGNFNPAKDSPATQAQMALLFTQKGTPAQQREAYDWLQDEDGNGGYPHGG